MVCDLLGCGLNLFGHVMFLFEPYLNHALDDQVKSRIVRLGQTHVVTVYHLLFPCMDTELWNMKQEKLAKASLFIEDEKNSLKAVYECSQTRIQQLCHKVTTKSVPEQKQKEYIKQPDAKKKGKGKCKVPVTEKQVQSVKKKLPLLKSDSKATVQALAAPLGTKRKESPEIPVTKTASQKRRFPPSNTRRVLAKFSPTIVRQDNLWFCQNENCKLRLNRKPTVVCGACKTPKGTHIIVTARKLKRKV